LCSLQFVFNSYLLIKLLYKLIHSSLQMKVNRFITFIFCNHHVECHNCFHHVVLDVTNDLIFGLEIFDGLLLQLLKHHEFLIVAFFLHLDVQFVDLFHTCNIPKYFNFFIKRCNEWCELAIFKAFLLDFRPIHTHYILSSIQYVHLITSISKNKPKKNFKWFLMLKVHFQIFSNAYSL